MKKNRWICLLLACLLLLPACSTGGQEPAPEPEDGVTTLIYGKISEDGVDQKRLDEFNRKHKGEVRIEVRDYTQLSEGGRQGVNLLMAEMVAGKGPDIIELGTSGETSLLSYRRLAEKGYLEDLWPYIDGDPKLGRREDGSLRGVMEAPLKAAEVNGGLYAIFEFVRLHTLIGAKSVVGDRTDWTAEELLETFASMPEGSVILEDYQNWKDSSVKQTFLTSLLYGFSDLFIDWENGECFFDGEKFRSLLELTNQLPNQYDLKRNCANRFEAKEEHSSRIRDGAVMLEDAGIGVLGAYTNQYNLYWTFGEKAFVGYPMGDGSTGSYYEPLGIKLAMSSTCRNKDAAWQYMRQMYFMPKNQYTYRMLGLCVGTVAYRRDVENATQPSGTYFTYIDGVLVRVPPMTKEELGRIEELCSGTARSSLLSDKELVDLVTEVAGAYFAGDKSLDEAVRLIQNRASLYVNERR